MSVYIYCIIVYALGCVAVFLTLESFGRMVNLFRLNDMAKGVISIVIFTLCVVPFFTTSDINGEVINRFSLASMLYTIFDTPSFLCMFVCIFSILRSFSPKIGFMISSRGLAFLFIAWTLLAFNTFGIFDWYYGSINYKILIMAIFISFGYCVDRILGVLLLMSFAMWIIFARYIDIYHAMFDFLVCTICFILQSVPTKQDRFHVALLKPKMRR